MAAIYPAPAADVNPNITTAFYRDYFHERVIPTLENRRRSEVKSKLEMADVASRYHGDYVIPLKNTSGSTTEMPMVAAMVLANAIEDGAQRANESDPTILAPEAPNARNTEARGERATLRRKAWAAHWHDSQMALKRARAFRHFFAYGTFHLEVRPDFGDQRAKTITRNPLYSYPEPRDPDDVRPPHDIASLMLVSGPALLAQYPDREDVKALIGPFGDQQMWEVVRWVDDDHFLVGIVGIQHESRRSDLVLKSDFNRMNLFLQGHPNRLGKVPVICPTAVTLDRIQSAIARAMPVSDLMNRVAALNYIAVEKEVIPDRYVVGADGRRPLIISNGGNWAPGESGVMNVLEDVKSIGTLSPTPGAMTPSLLAQLERSVRMTTSSPSLNQGEISGSIRSGQTVSQLNSYAIDPGMKEAHMVMSYALTYANQCVAEVELAYWPKRRYTAFTGWDGDNAVVEYTPEEIWEETKANNVRYPFPGMDVVNATLAIAQMNQTGMLSRKTGRMMHPLVTDPLTEEHERAAEVLDQAMEISIAQQIAAGQLALTDAARARQLVEEKRLSLADAILAAQAEAQERQVSIPPPAAEDQIAPPESAAGLNDPNAGGQAPLPPEPAPGGPGAAPGGPGLGDLLAAFAAQPGG